MADKKISEMTSMTAAQIANDDNIVISDTSDSHTKRAPISELATFFGVNQEGIQDTVGAMFTGGTMTGLSATYDDPNGVMNFSLAGGVTTAEMGHLNGVTSDIQTQLNSKSPLASPTFTGNPIAPTQSANNSSTRIATTEYVQGELNAYASDTVTFTNKAGNISQWTNNSGFMTPSSTATLTNKTGSISQWTNNSGYITATSTDTLNNKTISGANNTISNVPYSALSSVDEDISSVSGSHNTIASAKAVKDYVDGQITGINELSEATDTNISSPSTGQVLVYDGTNSWDNQTTTVALTGDVTGSANMDASGDVSIATTIPNDTVTINGVSVALGGSGTVPSVLQSGGTFTGDIELNDNVKASFGDDQDFEIYHSGSASIVREASSGNLVLAGNDVNILNGAMNETHIDCNNNGSVELYFDNNFKFSTLTDGARIVGNLTISGNVDGRDVATDGTKLDGIAAGAEVNVKANWTESSSSSDAFIQNKPSLSTVATSGSYADLSNKPTIPTNNNQLTNGAGYITSATDSTKLPLAGGTMSGNLTMGANEIFLSDNGGIRLGNSEDLQIVHDGTDSIIKDHGTGALEIRATDFRLNNSANTKNMIKAFDGGSVNLFHNNTDRARTTSSGFAVTGELTCTGNMTSSNNVTAYSDIRLKSDIKTIDNALDKVSQMRGVTFIKDGELSSGVIAQEMEKVAPELVVDGEYKSVAYGNTVGYLIEAIKELKGEVDELKTKLCECKD